jgi:hypothetical protein
MEKNVLYPPSTTLSPSSHEAIEVVGGLAKFEKLRFPTTPYRFVSFISVKPAGPCIPEKPRSP